MRLLDRSRASTAAAGAADPLASVTMPVMVPLELWAARAVDRTNNRIMLRRIYSTSQLGVNTLQRVSGGANVSLPSGLAVRRGKWMIQLAIEFSVE